METLWKRIINLAKSDLSEIGKKPPMTYKQRRKIRIFKIEYDLEHNTQTKEHMLNKYKKYLKKIRKKHDLDGEDIWVFEKRAGLEYQGKNENKE